MTITPDAAVTIFSVTNGIDITGVGTAGVITVSALAAKPATLNGPTSFVVTGNSTIGAITFNSTATGTKSTVESANDRTITNNATSGAVSVDATLQTGTTTLAGSGDFTVTGLVAASGKITSGGTGNVSVAGTAAAAHTVTGGVGNDIVTFTGAGTSVLTINPGAGNDTVTLTTTNAVHLVDLGAGNDTYTAGIGGGVVTGGSGSDTMTGGAGADVFRYATALDSSGVNTDTINGLNFSADVIRLTSTMTSNAFNAATTTSTTVGYNNYTATTASSGTINVLSDEGMMAVSTSSSTNAPSVSGSLQSTAVIQYYITATNVANTITTSNGNDSITGGAVVDTINSGDGDDSVVGGLGGDIINVGAGTEVVYIGALDSAATIATGGNTANHDKITGLGVGDKIATGLTMTAVTTGAIAALGTTYGVTEAAVIIRGTYDPTANTAAGSFTNATGNDLYFVFDKDGTAGNLAYVGVVIVGGYANGIRGLTMLADGTATFTG